MFKKQKLELTWIGKDEEPRLEPRILIEDPEKSYGDKSTQNMLIHGDNLLALKALEQDFAGKIKCIYIDPPYNTGNAFEHYDDGLEHSTWLNLIKPRLEFLKDLLSKDGSIWISIDDTEAHYLKVLCDEVFGRNNFVIQITVKRSAPTGHKAINPSPIQVCDYILVYARNKSEWNYKHQYTERDYDDAYSQVITNFDEAFENWKFTSIKLYLKDCKLSIEEAINNFPERIIRFAQPAYEGVGQETRELIDLSKKNPTKVLLQKRADHPDIYLYNGNRILFYKDKLKTINGKLVTAELLTNLWLDVPFQGIAGEGNVIFQKSKKPEKMIKRIIEISTLENEWILDSFLGSGTTAAVAHKMGRKWIGIELGEHASTHCLPRLKKVCDGTDQGGISKAVNWKGGGGFKFYELAPSLLKKDKYDNWIIDERYNADMLAAAMAKHEGFKYCPNTELYWKQGQSTEKDFIFTTTQMVTAPLLDRIHEEMRDDEGLLICCKSYQKICENKYPNITIKKIPNMLLGRCEFGKEDYSLNIIDMPYGKDEEDFIPVGPDEEKEMKSKKNIDQNALF